MVPVCTTFSSPIDVRACVENIDVLLGSPTRDGRVYNLCLSLSPEASAERVKTSPKARCEDYINQKLNFGSEEQESSDNEDSTLVLMIPVEVLLQILRHIPPETLGCLRRVCKSWKLVVDTHQEFLFKPLCIARGWVSEIRLDDSNKENDNSTTPTRNAIVPFCNADGWLNVFATNYGTQKNWQKRSKYGLSPWRSEKAAAMTFSTATWGHLLEASLTS
eukprot:m.68877 g.68877  ORF g.68877 m.68877 type:complete len:219 (-) comp16012_c0_seq1:1001-1657(-)